MKDIKHIWFDFAGVIYEESTEFKKAHDDFLVYTYAKLKDIKDSEIAEKEVDQLRQQYGSNSAIFRSLGQLSDFWMKKLDSFNFSMFLDPNLEISNALKELKNVIPISLFTNFVKYRIDSLLSHLDIPKGYFTYIIAGDDIKERKPALDGFYAMIDRSKLPPGQLLYVGDRVDVDIKPAKKVGMKTCLIYSNSEQADFCVSNLNELLDLIR